MPASKHLNWVQSPTPNKNPGVYVTLQELIRYRFKASGFSFLPKQPVHSLLSGKHASRLRGRGLNFEEIRQYQLGDDIRSMDWKITARTLKPHVRVFTEERDRPVFFIVDQRVSMFFGSVQNMKSVSAAQGAALGAWRSLSQGDRVGGCVFNDAEISTIKPSQSENRLNQFFQQIVQFNNALSANNAQPNNRQQLNLAIDHACDTLKHDGLCCIISDGLGFDQETQNRLMSLCAKNDVLWGQIFDPLEVALPEGGQLTVGDAQGQLHIQLSKKLSNQFSVNYQEQQTDLHKHLTQLGIPILKLSTHAPVEEQIRQQLGYAPAIVRQ